MGLIGVAAAAFGGRTVAEGVVLYEVSAVRSGDAGRGVRVCWRLWRCSRAGFRRDRAAATSPSIALQSGGG